MGDHQPRLHNTAKHLIGSLLCRTPVKRLYMYIGTVGTLSLIFFSSLIYSNDVYLLYACHLSSIIIICQTIQGNLQENLLALLLLRVVALAIMSICIWHIHMHTFNSSIRISVIIDMSINRQTQDSIQFSLSYFKMILGTPNTIETQSSTLSRNQ